MSERKTILLISTHNNTFVRTDREILLKNHNVNDYHFTMGGSSFRVLISMFGQFFFLIFNCFRYDILFIWFAGYHSFIPTVLGRVLRKKVFLVAGGYDVERNRFLKYGAFTSKLSSFFTIRSIQYACKVLAVSSYVARKLRHISRRNDIVVVYNALSIKDTFRSERLNRQVLTVGNIYSKSRFFVKGIDRFVELSKLCPLYEFVIVGAKSQDISKWYGDTLPKNLTVIEKQAHSELSNYYSKAEIYCQLSRYESFGMAVAEAIYFGCQVLTTKAGGMPEIAGSFGIFPGNDLTNWARMIHEIIENDELRANSKQLEYIQQNFSKEKRTKTLLTLISENA